MVGEETTTSSPSSSQTRGWRTLPTPAGVPVETMSPGSSVISFERCDVRAATEKTRSSVEAACSRSIRSTTSCTSGRVDKPASLFKVGDAVEAEVTAVDSREKRIGLSIKALRKSEERADMEAYLARERDSGRFSFADVMPEAEKPKAPCGQRQKSTLHTLRRSGVECP